MDDNRYNGAGGMREPQAGAFGPNPQPSMNPSNPNGVQYMQQQPMQQQPQNIGPQNMGPQNIGPQEANVVRQYEHTRVEYTGDGKNVARTVHEQKEHGLKAGAYIDIAGHRSDINLGINRHHHDDDSKKNGHHHGFLHRHHHLGHHGSSMDDRQSFASVGAFRPRSRSGLHIRDMEEDMTDFFARNSVPVQAGLPQCLDFARSRLPPGTLVEPLRSQGYCSLTLLAGHDTIVQFRPKRYALDVNMIEEARAVFGPVVPVARDLGYVVLPLAGGSGSSVRHETYYEERPEHRGFGHRLKDRILHPFHHNHNHHHHHHEHSQAGQQYHQYSEQMEGRNQTIMLAYSMPLVAGTPLPAQRLVRLSPEAASSNRASLVRSLAKHFATAWRNGRYPYAPRRPRSLVASTLRSRLEAMSRTMPPRFHGCAASVLARLPQIEELPWVLTHTDFVPVNVFVDPNRGSITGLIDWGEAEYLPFGVGMYAFEELLSHAATLPEEEGPQNRGRRWAFYPDTAALRGLFWRELISMVPELNDKHMLETVMAAWQMGVLLQCGIAFDDGRNDRVVQEGRDASEIAKLNLFLLSPEGCVQDNHRAATATLHDLRSPNHSHHDHHRHDGGRADSTTVIRRKTTYERDGDGSLLASHADNDEIRGRKRLDEGEVQSSLSRARSHHRRRGDHGHEEEDDSERRRSVEITVEEKRRRDVNPYRGAFLNSRTDDEENVQELEGPAPIRYRL